MFCPHCGKEIDFGLVPVRERRSKLNYFPCEIRDEANWFEVQYDKKDISKEVYREPRCPECDNYLFKHIYSVNKEKGRVIYGTEDLDEFTYLKLLDRFCQEYYHTKDKGVFWESVTDLTNVFLDGTLNSPIEPISVGWSEEQFLDTLFAGLSKLLTDCISVSSLSLLFVATENKYTFITDLASIFGAYTEVLKERLNEEES